MTLGDIRTYPLAVEKARPTLGRMTIWDGAAIVVLGTAGFAFSYDALRQIGLAIHARPLLSYLFPVFVDGFIAYGVRALVLLRNCGFGARLYAWFLFLTATGASLWANALRAITLNHEPRSAPSTLHLGDGVVGVLSTLAPLALAGSVHLYILMARTAESSVRDDSDSGPGRVREGSDPSMAERNTDASEVGCDEEPDPERPAADGPQMQPGDQRGSSLANVPVHPWDSEGDPSAGREHSEHPVRDASGSHDSIGPAANASSSEHPSSVEPVSEARSQDAADVRTPDDGEAPVPDGDDESDDREPVDEWLRELLPLAREAAREAGRISRSAVQEAVRAQCPISNDRLGELLTLLKAEEADAEQPDPDSASGGS